MVIFDIGDDYVNYIFVPVVVLVVAVFWSIIAYWEWRGGDRRLSALSLRTYLALGVVLVGLIGIPVGLFGYLRSMHDLAEGRVQTHSGSVHSYVRNSSGRAPYIRFCVEAKCFGVAESTRLGRAQISDGNSVRVSYSGTDVLKIERVFPEAK